MKKVWLLTLCAIAFLCVSCNQKISQQSSASEDEFSKTSSTHIQTPELSSDNLEHSSEQSLMEDHPEENVGGGSYCMAHNELYHSYDVELLSYVGPENAEAWGKSVAENAPDTSDAFVEAVNIVSFVEYFNIPKATFIELTRGGLSQEFLNEFEGGAVFTLEQIDAIYSGDQAQINAAFCGPLAFVGEADGKLYSIYWLADHSAEDYVEAGLPMDKVEEILTLAQEEYAMDSSIAALTETVQDTLSRAIALEEELAAGGASEAAE